MSADTKAIVQLGLALVGAAVLAGSIVGALYGATREAVGYWTAGEVEAE